MGKNLTAFSRAVDDLNRLKPQIKAAALAGVGIDDMIKFTMNQIKQDLNDEDVESLGFVIHQIVKRACHEIYEDLDLTTDNLKVYYDENGQLDWNSAITYLDRLTPVIEKARNEGKDLKLVKKQALVKLKEYLVNVEKIDYKYRRSIRQAVTQYQDAVWNAEHDFAVNTGNKKRADTIANAKSSNAITDEYDEISFALGPEPKYGETFESLKTMLAQAVSMKCNAIYRKDEK